jgi:AcrR family transcriptional regulator
MTQTNKSTSAKRVSRLPKPESPTVKGSNQSVPGLPGCGPGLPPTAQRLLEAARRLLARSGYNSLSVEAIGREAGENKALIRYYFGSKNGLIVALIGWLISETLWHAGRRLTNVSGEESPSQIVTASAEALLEDTPSYRLFFDLLPRVLEEPSMAGQFAELYRAYRDQNTRALWVGGVDDAPPIVRDIAAMTVALADGLAVQTLAEPGSVDVSRALATWRALIDQVLGSTPLSDTPPAETSDI